MPDAPELALMAIAGAVVVLVINWLTRDREVDQ